MYCTLVQHWYKCYLYLCVVFENGALKINTCACVVLVLCGAKFDSDVNDNIVTVANPVVSADLTDQA